MERWTRCWWLVVVWLCAAGWAHAEFTTDTTVSLDIHPDALMVGQRDVSVTVICEHGSVIEGTYGLATLSCRLEQARDDQYVEIADVLVDWNPLSGRYEGSVLAPAPEECGNYRFQVSVTITPDPTLQDWAAIYDNLCSLQRQAEEGRLEDG